MKRIIACLIVAVMILSSVSCYAKTVERKDMGIELIVSNDWIDESEDDVILFSSGTDNENEGIAIYAVETELAYDIDNYEEEFLKNLSSKVLSDEELKEIAEDDVDYARISAHDERSSYEYYNGVKYFRYEKAFTLSSPSYYDTELYVTMLLTARNGRLYIWVYSRDSIYNNFADVEDMLNSASYDSGEIKIKIDGERIYPDTAPMLIEGRTLVPIRAVAEKMGYIVEWNEEDQIVSMFDYVSGNVIGFGIGYSIYLKNDTDIPLDVPAMLYGGRTYIPLRAAVEAMDATVIWNEPENTVEIYR